MVEGTPFEIAGKGNSAKKDDDSEDDGDIQESGVFELDAQDANGANNDDTG
jgi:hypothetical protein